MADENTKIHELARNVRRADGRLDSLRLSAGRGAFAQRAMKGNFKRAARAPAMGGMGGGMGGMRSEAALDLGSLQFGREALEESRAAGQSVRTIGNRTFYRREGRWIDSVVTEEQEKQAQRVKQFSDEYFALARRHGPDMAQYMVFDEPVLLNLAGQTILIEP